MKQRHLAGPAALLVGSMGGAAFGHDHVGGPQEDCSQYPLSCHGQCYELNACRSGNTPIGGSDCLTEENNLAACAINPPPFIPPPPVVPPPPVIVVPPPACPAGQYFNQGECQDPECGDDEIAGEDGSCTECGKGKVPNHNKTTCISCPHGESGQFPGRCDPACWHTATDKVAKDALLGVPAEPKERGASVYCLKETVHIASWTMSTPSNACQVTFGDKYAGPSCWGGGSKTDGCNLSQAHTHPFFSYPRDKTVTCHGTTISSKQRARSYNSSGREFSEKDKRNARNADVLGHLGLPPDEPPEGTPSPTDRDTVKALRRSGKVEEI